MFISYSIVSLEYFVLNNCYLYNFVAVLNKAPIFAHISPTTDE